MMYAHKKMMTPDQFVQKASVGISKSNTNHLNKKRNFSVQTDLSLLPPLEVRVVNSTKETVSQNSDSLEEKYSRNESGVNHALVTDERGLILPVFMKTEQQCDIIPSKLVNLSDGTKLQISTETGLSMKDGKSDEKNLVNALLFKQKAPSHSKNVKQEIQDTNNIDAHPQNSGFYIEKSNSYFDFSVNEVSQKVPLLLNGTQNIQQNGHSSSQIPSVNGAGAFCVENSCVPNTSGHISPAPEILNALLSPNQILSRFNAGKAASKETQSYEQTSLLQPCLEEKPSGIINLVNGDCGDIKRDELKSEDPVTSNLNGIVHQRTRHDITSDQTQIESTCLSCDSKNKKDPPIAIFWDIENLAVPTSVSAASVVNEIRRRFLDGRREVNFMCVCDTLATSPDVLKALNETRVNIVHVGHTRKNEADDKILVSMRRFADAFGKNSVLLLMSSDSDFLTEIIDLRYRSGIYIILIHNGQSASCLVKSVHEAHRWEELVGDLPRKNPLYWSRKRPKHEGFHRYMH